MSNIRPALDAAPQLYRIGWSACGADEFGDIDGLAERERQRDTILAQIDAAVTALERLEAIEQAANTLRVVTAEYRAAYRAGDGVLEAWNNLTDAEKALFALLEGNRHV